MKPALRFALVLVTAPDLKTARKLVRSALEARLVACGNVVPKIESHYWWKGKIESSAEVLILFKTSVKLLRDLESLIVSEHPYDTPEVLAVYLSKGTRRYLEWILDSTRAS
jgi:periplasmic divalent cation tolerance protein